MPPMIFNINSVRVHFLKTKSNHQSMDHQQSTKRQPAPIKSDFHQQPIKVQSCINISTGWSFVKLYLNLKSIQPLSPPISQSLRSSFVLGAGSNSYPISSFSLSFASLFSSTVTLVSSYHFRSFSFSFQFVYSLYYKCWWCMLYLVFMLLVRGIRKRLRAAHERRHWKEIMKKEDESAKASPLVCGKISWR